MGADVTVRGAGIFGLAIGYACAVRGARVQVIDPVGIAAGASGGLVGALAPHVPENWNAKKAFQLESLLMADAFWAQIAALSGRDPGYARLGRVQPLADVGAVALARARGDTAQTLWQGRAEWRVVPVAKLAQETGWAVQSPTGLAVFDSLSARINPQPACAALAAAIAALGGQFFLGSQAAAARPKGVQVWATGAQGLMDMSAMARAHGAPRSIGAGVKGQALSLAYNACSAPQLFIDGLHVVPQANGTTAIGSTTERDYTSPTTTDAALDELLGRVRVAMPQLAQSAVLARWAGLRPRSQSRAPMLGALPADLGGGVGHYVANGGFKIGFGMAPKVAEVMADLVLEGRDTIPVGFRVSDNF